MTSLASHQPAATAPPAGVTVAAVAEAGGGLEVVFGPDGHRATFDRAFLAARAGSLA